MKTIIRVRKADGSVKDVERAGHITDPGERASIAASAVKLGAEVIQWRLIGSAPRQETASGRARQRVDRYNARPRSNSADTARCKGCGRIGDDGECGLGHY